MNTLTQELQNQYGLINITDAVELIANTPEWLEARKGGIGGSDVANILGTPDAFGSPLSTWYDKTEGDDFSDSEAMYWGRQLEDTIRRSYQEQSGNAVVEVDALLTGKYPHEKANIDGLVHDGDTWGILEIKNVGSFGAPQWGTDSEPTVPSKYIAQVQWYMYVTGLQYAKVVALIGGQKLVVRHVDRDEDFISEASEVCGIFWHEHVTPSTAPSNIGSDKCVEILKKINPPTIVEATELDDSKDLLDLWLEYSTHEKEFKALKKKVEAQLLEEIGSHQKATLGGKSVATYKPTTRNTVDSKKLKADYPEVYDAVVKVSTSNTFKVSYKGAK